MWITTPKQHSGLVQRAVELEVQASIMGPKWASTNCCLMVLRRVTGRALSIVKDMTETIYDLRSTIIICTGGT